MAYEKSLGIAGQLEIVLRVEAAVVHRLVDWAPCAPVRNARRRRARVSYGRSLKSQSS